MPNRFVACASLVCAFALSMLPRDAQADGCPGGPPDAIEVPDCNCLVTFSQTFTGTYRHGEPADVLTIDPSSSGETLAERGITIRIRIAGVASGPWAGVPAEEILLYNSALCLCPGGNIADHATDQDGRTEFSGTIRGGGCAGSLSLFVCGISMGTLPIKINSTDSGTASPCFTDASDLAALATKLGRPDLWDLCFDYNESGAPVDASDVAYFANSLGAACR